MSERRLKGRTSDRIICVERATRSDQGAVRWRAYLSSDDEVVIFCPDCAVREFGETTSLESYDDER